MAKKTTSAHQKALYLQYKNEDRWLKNKILRLQRHYKRNPNDSQARKALENVNFQYSRNKFKGLKKEAAEPRLAQQSVVDSRLSFAEALGNAMGRKVEQALSGSRREGMSYA